MIRRGKAGDGLGSPGPISRGNSSGRTTSSSGTGTGTGGGGLVRRTTSDKDHSKSSPVKLLVIITVVIVGSFFMLAVISPSSAQKVETEAFKIEQAVEEELLKLGGGTHDVPPLFQHEDEPRDTLATEEMLRQSSSWVDGEKKLKKQLKLLAERQNQGKDLGVPVLTRYLGEDIPAWAGEGVNVEEWQKKVDAKYAEMAEDELKWRAEVAQLMTK